MRTLITNLKGKDLFDTYVKNNIDKLVSVYTNYNQNSLFDQYMEKENIKIDTTNSIELCEILTKAIREAKEKGEVYVATDGEFIGSILNFTANKEEVDVIYYCFNNQTIQMPKLKLNITKTKLKILNVLKEEEQTAILIGKKIGISRSMVYKHINNLIAEGLVGQTKRYEKYFLTDAGKMTII